MALINLENVKIPLVEKLFNCEIITDSNWQHLAAGYSFKLLIKDTNNIISENFRYENWHAHVIPL